MASYKVKLADLCTGVEGFAARRDVFLNHRYGASHVLKPVLEGAENAFFTNGDDEALQWAWAHEHGLKTRNLDDILLAQIEAHRTEVFYNLDPTRYGGAFLRRLPAHVRRKIAWRAAPGTLDLRGYDLLVANFPSILARYQADGINTAEFFPAHDPELDAYAANTTRDIDVLFIGGYSRHHAKRSQLLLAVAQLQDRYNVVFHLDRSRYTRLAETPLGFLPSLAKHRRPGAVRAITRPPVFGRQMYEALSRAKIVVNMAIDMAGTDRGNMRCFEAMGAKSLLLSDAGVYPQGMENGKSFRIYATPEDAVRSIAEALSSQGWQQTAERGFDMIRTNYSKDAQMARFMHLV
jgi:hypothetical protein